MVARALSKNTKPNDRLEKLKKEAKSRSPQAYF